MNKEYYEKVKALREQGKTYQEVADQIGDTRRHVQDYCGRHKELQYSEEERSNVERVAWNKGQTFANFEKNVEKKYAGEFELVSVGEPNEKSERSITIRCKTCGTEKTVSTITLRGDRTSRCLVCHPQEYRSGTSKETIVKEEIKRLQSKLATEKRKTKKKLKKNQVGLKLCECGQAFLLSTQSVCDECKRKKRRACETRKEIKRRMRAESAGDFDKTITTEALIIRDHNICYLCGCECDSNDFKRVNDFFVAGPNYPSIEHVIPLAKGGTHTWDNVKLAHVACNTKKGTKLLAG